MNLVDSHCHLNYEGLVDQQAAVLERARQAGITAFLNISTRQSEWSDVVATATREPDVWATVGIHPHEADQHADLGESVLRAATQDPRVIGLGESGLDYHYDRSDRAVQRDLFRMHIRVARETGLPLVIHTRDAEEDTAAILADEMGQGAFPALIHCFTASAAFGRKVLELGLTISISGIVTFKNAAELQDFAREIPRDRLAGRDRQPLPGAGAASRPHMRAGLRARYRALPGRAARRAARGARRLHVGQLLRPVRQGSRYRRPESGSRVKLIMLGSGTSTGVPRIGNDWGECDPADPKNRRTRVSVIVENDAGARLLVDTSPDLRRQLLDARIDRVDAVFWTHDHADHCHGIDDLRPLRFGRTAPLPGFADERTVRRLRQRFGYVFKGQHGYPSIVELAALDHVKILVGFGIDHVAMPHGPSISTGYRFEADGKSIGYATDFSEITDEMLALFSGIDILVTDCLRRESHPTHASLATALEFAERTGARCAVLTHLDKSMDYEAVSAEVPGNVIVGYDGLELSG